MDLVKYDAACRALAEAKRVDEAKDILDIAIAMAVYARQAENHQLEADAVEIRLRAQRRIGQLMALAEAGIHKNLAHRARQLAKQPDTRFEATVAQARDDALRAARNVISQGDKTARDEEMNRLREANPDLAGLTAKKLKELKRNGKAVESL
jgi:hypothetical protein